MHAYFRKIDGFFSVRYLGWTLSIVLAVWLAFRWQQTGTGAVPALVAGILALMGLRDSLQRQRSVLRNYPLIGHLRFLLEFIRPEIRQYFLGASRPATSTPRQAPSMSTASCRSPQPSCLPYRSRARIDLPSTAKKETDHDTVHR